MIAPDLSSCTPGNYPWDEWQTRPIESGLDEDLAELGRAVFREAYQHSWDEALKSECGWDDNGEDMLKFVLASPDKTRERWTQLITTDGLRAFDNQPEP